MRISSLFFILSLMFAKNLLAQNYFTGDFSEADLHKEEPLKKVEGAVATPPALSSDLAPAPEPTSKFSKPKKEITPTSQEKEDSIDELDAINLKSADIKPKEKDVDFFMNDIKAKDDLKAVIKDDTEKKKEEGLFISYFPTKNRTLISGLRECVFGLKVENLTPNVLKRLRIKFIWTDKSTGMETTRPLVFKNISAGADSQSFYKQPGDTICKIFSAVEFPKAKIESCLMENVTEMQCAKSIKLRK